MVKSPKTRSAQALLLAACLLLAAVMAPAAMADSGGIPEDRSIFFGKVTAINGDYVTVAIGTLGMPQMPDQSADNGQNGAGQGTPPAGGRQGGGGRSFFDSLTLNGESVTVQITDSVALTRQSAQARREGNGTFDAAPPQGTPPAGGDGSRGRGSGGMGFFGGEGEEAGLSDLSVGSIVMLTYQTSSQALLAVQIMGSAEAAAN